MNKYLIILVHNNHSLQNTAVVTIGQRAESLSVGVGADHLLVSHHPGRGVVHLGEGEAHGSAGTQNWRQTLSLAAGCVCIWLKCLFFRRYCAKIGLGFFFCLFAKKRVWGDSSPRHLTYCLFISSCLRRCGCVQSNFSARCHTAMIYVVW